MRRRRDIDWSSLHVRGLVGVGALALVAAVFWIATTETADHGARSEAALARASGTARTLARSIEELGLLDDPSAQSALKRLTVAAAEGPSPAPSIRVLLPDESVSSVISLDPDQAHPAAFQVLATSVEHDPATALDYLPEMSATVFEAREASAQRSDGDLVVAYAPVKDEWNHTRALVRIEARAGLGFWRGLGELLLRTIGALSGVALVVAASDALIRRHCEVLRDLGSGIFDGALEQRFVSKEVRAIAQTMASLRERAQRRRRFRDAPAAPAEGSGTTRGPRGARGAPERQVFDVSALLNRAAAAFQARAAEKELALEVQVGERVPRLLAGHPRALLAALSPLLENAVRYTRRGSIQLRVTRVLDRPEFRFEVGDTGVGIPWQSQPPLDDVLKKAASRNPREFAGGLGRTSAIAAKLGGEAGFESQPGSGSRFFFTAQCEPAREGHAVRA